MVVIAVRVYRGRYSNRVNTPLAVQVTELVQVIAGAEYDEIAVWGDELQVRDHTGRLRSRRGPGWQ